jgi:UDP-glucose 6-dehydrogenase
MLYLFFQQFYRSHSLLLWYEVNKEARAGLVSGIEVEASKKIGTALREKSYHTVVVKSTVPPGTTGTAIKKNVRRRLWQDATHDLV